MKIHNECSFINPEGIAKVEEMYKATFVMESCIRNSTGDWCNFPAAIFYSETAHPQGSNYFALYQERMSLTRDPPRIMITDGISATEPFQGIQIGDDVYYSHYRHDYRDTGHGVAIDGGRDYTRLVGNIHAGKSVTLVVNKDKLEVVNDEVSE